MDDSLLIDAINTLLGLVPEHYKPHVEAALALISAGSGLLAAWRWAMAKWAPRAAASAPVVAIDRVLDYVVLNSRRLEVRPRVVRESMLPPPSRESTKPIGLPPPTQDTRDLVDLLRDAKVKEREP